MNDLYDLLNISKVPIEKRIQIAIAETKKELCDLTVDRTSRIYSSYLFANLSKYHVVSKIINTKDLGAEYEHLFNLVPINTMEYYLIDLTYPNFQNDKYFKELYDKGYEKVTDLNSYYAIVTGEKNTISIQNAFMKSNKIR